MEAYNRVLEAIAHYFSDRTAADVFLTRQCQFHLQKQPGQITVDDLRNLSHWVMVSGALLIGKDKAAEMSNKVLDISVQMDQVVLRLD